MDPCAFLLMRFPDLLLADLRNLLQQEHDCLEEYNASVVAIAPQVYLDILMFVCPLKTCCLVLTGIRFSVPKKPRA